MQFQFAAVHVLKDGTPQEAHVLGAHFFAFDPGASPDKKAVWSNVKTDTESEIHMFTGQYRQMQFAFTEPGVYLVQVNVLGHVRDERNRLSGAPGDWSPVSQDKSITSPVQWYTFHVGSEADLDLTLSAGAVSTTEGASTVPVTVTATNSGPNGAENAEVEINLPAGLSAPATLPAGATSTGCGVIAWEIGAIASGASRTLNFNATVDSGAAGKLTATAEIRSTTFDPDATNNAASAEVTLSGTHVRAPFFPGVTRTIVEHAVAGAHAGDPVAAVSPDGRALTYSLSGPCSNKFQVHSHGQIALAAGQSLNYEKQWEYPLVLHVSDGVNASGEADTAFDDSTPVLIQVEDTPVEAVHPKVNFSHDPASPVAGDLVRVWARVTGLDIFEDGNVFYCLWQDDAGNRISESNGADCHVDLQLQTAGTQRVKVHVKWTNGGMSANTSVTWSEASNN